MKKPEAINVEVDMVPLIDIISLLLMFLIVVGGAVDASGRIEMKLPRADQALREDRVYTEGRLVLELTPKNGKYFVVCNNKSYETVESGANQTLIKFLEKHVGWALEKDLAKRDERGAVNIPIKLRIPEAAPMHEVEKVVMMLTRVGLVNIQYAAQPSSDKH